MVESGNKMNVEEYCTNRIRNIMLKNHGKDVGSFKTIIKCLKMNKKHLDKYDPYENRYKC